MIKKEVVYGFVYPFFESQTRIKFESLDYMSYIEKVSEDLTPFKNTNDEVIKNFGIYMCHKKGYGDYRGKISATTDLAMQGFFSSIYSSYARRGFIGSEKVINLVEPSLPLKEKMRVIESDTELSSFFEICTLAFDDLILEMTLEEL